MGPLPVRRRGVVNSSGPFADSCGALASLVPAHPSYNIFAPTSFPYLPFQRKTARCVQSMICFMSQDCFFAKDHIIFEGSVQQE